MKPVATQYARKEVDLDSKQKFDFLNEKGLTLCAPGGCNYNFKNNKGKPTATLEAQADNVDYKVLSTTIISMIDNVLAKGSAVNIDTGDPRVAQIASQYCQYLHQSLDIDIPNFTIKFNGNEYKPDATASQPNESLDKLIKEIDNASQGSPWKSDVVSKRADKTSDRTNRIKEQLQSIRSPLKEEQSANTNTRSNLP